MILIGYKQTFGDLLASSPVFPELDVWLENKSEQYCPEEPLAIRSSDMTLDMTLPGEVFIVLPSAPCMKEVFCAVDVPALCRWDKSGDSSPKNKCCADYSCQILSHQFPPR